MNPTTSKPVSRRTGHTTYRWIRQAHLWVGAWGALAAVLYGFTGLVMNHRMGDGKWPQGDSDDAGMRTLSIPAEVRTSPEALSLWLRDTQHLDAQVIRKPRPDEKSEGPTRWTLSGGTAANSWALQYAAGSDRAELKMTRHSMLAAFNRLHKTVGGGIGWVILADSFAICMLLLGLSGLWMWARGRGTRQVVLSVLAASVAAMLVVLVPALL